MVRTSRKNVRSNNMSNITGKARSNRFRVNNYFAFKQWADGLDLVVYPDDDEQSRYVWISAELQDTGTWPTTRLNLETEEHDEINFTQELGFHLDAGSVAVLFEIANTELQYVGGIAVAVNRAGSCRISLEDIYTIAQGMGDEILRIDG